LSFFVASFVVTGFLKPLIAGLVFLIFDIVILILNGKFLKVFFQNFHWQRINFYKIMKLIGLFLILSYSLLLIIVLTSGLIDFFQNKTGCPLCP
jgi:hypothetical protein